MPTPKGIPIDGEKLYQARLAARLSAARLGEMLGVGGPHVRYIERGLRPVSIELLGRLERVLGVSAADLGADVPPARPPQMPQGGSGPP